MIRSILIVTSGILVTAFFSLWVIIAGLFPEGGRSSRRVACRWAKVMLFIAGTKIEVIGRENIITDRPQIFMANHQGDFDILIFLAAVSTDFLWIAKKELFRVPLFGKAMEKAGYISIDRQNPQRAMKSVDRAAERLKDGISIASFPEGTRSRHGRLLPFKQGMFYLALQSGAPIVPVAIIGSGKIMPKKSLRINRGEIIMVIDKPIAVDGYEIETRFALMDRVRNVILANCEKYQSKENASLERGGL